MAERLGYADATNAMKQHCKGVAKHHPLWTAGGVQEIKVLSRPDVLRLITYSKLEAAKRFECWVFEDVLPTIHDTGAYGTPDPATLLNDPAALRTLLLSYSEKVIRLEGEKAVLRPRRRRSPLPPAVGGGDVSSPLHG